MGLSWDLQVQLYPEVLTFGPSGVAVAALFSAVESECGLDGSAMGDVTGFPIDCLRLQMSVDGGWEDFALPADAVREQLLFDVLLVEAQRLSPWQWCVAFVGMALSAEWFSPVVRAQFTAFTGEVNDLLGSLKLPALAPAGVSHA